MTSRHEEELNAFIKELDENLSLKPKDNTEILNLKKMEE